MKNIYVILIIIIHEELMNMIIILQVNVSDMRYIFALLLFHVGEMH